MRLPLVLDGGLATSLEARGHDLSDRLWSARLLRDDPDEIRAVHAAHIAAGAQVVTTASYQASREGFTAVGMSEAQADALMRLSVSVARDAGDALVAASIGPYGAMLAGGQEYVGNYGVDASVIRDFHARRIEVLASASPDLLAAETIPDLREAEVLVPLLEQAQIPYWLSFSCADGADLNAGQSFAEGVAVVADTRHCIAVGVNCTKPEHVEALLSSAESPLPFVVYPNAGRTWDGANRTWLDEGLDHVPAAEIRRWVRAGAQVVGGCCGLGEAHIATVASTLT
jgi:homocysteine S-methyltransferase